MRWSSEAFWRSAMLELRESYDMYMYSNCGIVAVRVIVSRPQTSQVYTYFSISQIFLLGSVEYSFHTKQYCRS